jgi:hypothetical protein
MLCCEVVLIQVEKGFATETPNWGLGIQIASSGVFYKRAIAKGHRMLKKRRVALTRNTDMCLLFDQRESYNNTN